MPATVVAPTGVGRRPIPSWVVLHGMTRPGRRHTQLRRFVRALAATRAVVVVPEIPEWIRLNLAADVTLPTIQAALQFLRTMPEAERGRTALVGFSFGSPQAILAGMDPSVRAEIAGVVGFGGYCDLERTVRFQLTGVHEWDGTLYRVEPDPYGRWIVGANFLCEIPGYEDAGDVARALWTLAAEAGDRQVPARGPLLARRARRLRESLPSDLRPVFDAFAPPGGTEPEPEEVEDLVIGLSEAGRRASPLLDPMESLEDVGGSVHLLHGRGDRLIPHTEALRMKKWLGRKAAGEQRPDGVRCTVTGLFAHSREDERPPMGELLLEALRFGKALAGVLGATERGGEPQSTAERGGPARGEEEEEV